MQPTTLFEPSLDYNPQSFSISFSKLSISTRSDYSNKYYTRVALTSLRYSIINSLTG